MTTALLAADEIMQKSDKRATRVSEKDFSLCSLHHIDISENTSMEEVSQLRNSVEVPDEIAIQIKKPHSANFRFIKIKKDKDENANSTITGIKMPSIFKSCNINVSKLYWLHFLGPLDYFSNFHEVELPCTFSWLLNQCAFLINVLSFDLYKEVCNIEKDVLKLQ